MKRCDERQRCRARRVRRVRPTAPNRHVTRSRCARGRARWSRPHRRLTHARKARPECCRSPHPIVDRGQMRHPFPTAAGEAGEWQPSAESIAIAARATGSGGRYRRSRRCPARKQASSLAGCHAVTARVQRAPRSHRLNPRLETARAGAALAQAYGVQKRRAMPHPRGWHDDTSGYSPGLIIGGKYLLVEPLGVGGMGQGLDGAEPRDKAPRWR